jgi:hypothetical protein
MRNTYSLISLHFGQRSYCFYLEMLLINPPILLKLMFKAVNTESVQEIKKSLEERKIIRGIYLSCLKSSNIEKLMSFNVIFDQNQQLYTTAKSNLFFSLVHKNNSEKLIEFSKKYNFLEFKQPFFEFVKICISESKFVKAKKLLKLARGKGWFCNDYFSLKNEIKAKYGEDKEVKFEDFL